MGKEINLITCLNNTAQIDSVLSKKQQIDSKIINGVQIASEMAGLNLVAVAYTAGESDNIDLNIDRQKRVITANIKEIQYASKENFPEIGSENLIYVDRSQNMAYFWRKDTGEYISLGKDLSGDLEALDAKIQGVSTEVTNEKTARESANAEIQGKIDTEKSERETADTTLQTNIDNEVNTRASEDIKLQDQITGNADKITALQNDLSTANTNISNNTTDIETNAENIAKNTAKIGENGTAIETNRADINSLKTSEIKDVLVNEKTAVDATRTANISVKLQQDSINSLIYNLLVNGENAGTINIPQDQFLKSATYDPSTHILSFVFETSTGEKTTPVDLSELIDAYTAGNGLDLTDAKFSVKIDPTSSSLLSVGENGLKLTEPTIDSELSETSTNAVQNKAVTKKLNEKAGKTDLDNYVTLDTVQTIKGQKTLTEPLKFDIPKQGGGGSSISINGSAYEHDTIAIGNESEAYSAGISIGQNSYGYFGVAVGSRAKNASGTFNGVALGNDANSLADQAIQIGGGDNSKAKTMQVFDYQLLDGNTGKIPIERLDLNNYVDLDSQQTITGLKTFSAETAFNGVAEHNANVNINNGVLKVADSANDIATLYHPDKIVIEENGETVTHTLTLPKKNGTLLTDADVLIDLKHSKLGNADEGTEKIDAWQLTDDTAKLSIYQKGETDTTGFTLSKNYTGFLYDGDFGTANVTLSANTASIASTDKNGNSTTLQVSPTGATLNGANIATTNDLLGAKLKNSKFTSGETELDFTEPDLAPSKSTNNDLWTMTNETNSAVGIYKPINYTITNDDSTTTTVTGDNFLGISSPENDVQTISAIAKATDGNNIVGAIAQVGLGIISLLAYSEGEYEYGSLTINKNDTALGNTKRTRIYGENIELQGDTAIRGNLTVSGTTTTKDTETLLVQDNVIVANSNKQTLVDLSGLALNKNATDTYGIMYDQATDSVKLGLGKLTDGKFTFNANEGNPVAIRDDSANLTSGHLLSWNSDKNMLVDSGKAVSDFATATTLSDYYNTQKGGKTGAYQFVGATKTGDTSVDGYEKGIAVGINTNNFDFTTEGTNNTGLFIESLTESYITSITQDCLKESDTLILSGGSSAL